MLPLLIAAGAALGSYYWYNPCTVEIQATIAIESIEKQVVNSVTNRHKLVIALEHDTLAITPEVQKEGALLTIERSATSKSAVRVVAHTAVFARWQTPVVVTMGGSAYDIRVTLTLKEPKDQSFGALRQKKANR